MKKLLIPISVLLITACNCNNICYSVGDFAQGGVVFWVDETGHHGLVCEKIDGNNVLEGIHWYAGTYGKTEAKGDGLFAGEMNTAIIVAASIALGSDGEVFIARSCNQQKITEGGVTYGDWYLPSKYELMLMFQNKDIINETAIANGGDSFADQFYISSTEADAERAWGMEFTDGYQAPHDKQVSCFFRAIRAF